MTESIIIARALADLNDTIKVLNNGTCEVRHWYPDGAYPEYVVEHRGSWESCVAYLKNELTTRALNLIGW